MEDFQPGRSYGKRIPRSIWEWPISYRDLEPHYTEVERLYGVAGYGEEDFGPLQKPVRGYPGDPLPLHPLNARLIAANRRCGLHPLPACRWRSTPLGASALRRAPQAGYVCPTGARSSAAQLLESAAARSRNLRIETQVEVDRLVKERGTGSTLISVIDRATGRCFKYRARRYVLGAGAIGSSLLLLRSGLDHPMIGRNYMMLLCSIVAGIYPQETSADSSFIKHVGFADFYFGTKKYPHKMGPCNRSPRARAARGGQALPPDARPLRQFLRSFASCRWLA